MDASQTRSTPYIIEISGWDYGIPIDVAKLLTKTTSSRIDLATVPRRGLPLVIKIRRFVRPGRCFLLPLAPNEEHDMPPPGHQI